MRDRDYQAELLSKMKAEQEKFRNWLCSKPPDEILKHTYEYTVRQDIVCAVENMELAPKKAKALLKSSDPLAEVYKDFAKLETDYMEIIRETVESRADKIIKWERENEAR